MALTFETGLRMAARDKEKNKAKMHFQYQHLLYPLQNNCKIDQIRPNEQAQSLQPLQLDGPL